jgi:hypothetical protein
MDLRVLAFACSVALVQESAPPPASAPAAPVDESLQIDAERGVDDVAFASFTAERRRLLAEGRGAGWVAIAGGEVLPRDERGAVAPAATFEKLLAVVDAKHPSARHRYLFRVDDPPRADESFVALNLCYADAFGNRCVELLGRDFSVSADEMTFGSGDRVHRFVRTDLAVEFPLRNPAAKTSTAIQLVPSTGYDGVFMLTRESAGRLGLARFEIPGDATLECKCDPGRFASCRRARVRVVLEDLGIDELLPALIWPAPGSPLAAAPPATFDDPIARERAADEEEYASGYVPWRERLVERGSAGRWLAIASGQIVPRGPGTESEGDLRGVPAPVATLEELLAKLAEAAPDAKHRFVFRVGEEGETSASYVSPTLPGSDALGVGFFQWIGEEYAPTFGPNATWIVRGDRRADLVCQSYHFELPCCDPAGAHAEKPTFVFSSPFTGTIVLNAATARLLGTELFEIPGAARLGPGPTDGASCRRARVRVVLPAIGLDRNVPVAVWPELAGK